jgi:hypothetical protein
VSEMTVHNNSASSSAAADVIKNVLILPYRDVAVLEDAKLLRTYSYPCCTKCKLSTVSIQRTLWI